MRTTEDLDLAPRIGKVNYFQYPPMRPIPDRRRADLLEQLDLQSGSAPGTVFTLFLSVPYCRVRCHSCPFFKALLPNAATRELLDAYLDVIEAQAHVFVDSHRFASASLGAVYLGGGTASVLSPAQIARLASFLVGRFPVTSNVEITLEGNPSDFTASYLAEIHGTGINRVSLGYQSSHEAILRKALNSPHKADEGLRAIEAALRTGFRTVNVDVMYRMPSQTRALWEADIATLLALRPQSITAYEYVIHEGSASEKLVARGRLADQVDTDTSHAWYLLANDALRAAGYVEQRIGSFVIPGHEQQYGHLSYTRSSESIGLGAGAYSFVNGYMFQTPSSPEAFDRLVRSVQAPYADRASPRASLRNLMERWVFAGLWGRHLDRGEFARRFAVDPLDVFSSEFRRLDDAGLVSISNDTIDLTELGVKRRHEALYTFYSRDFADA